MHWPQLVWFALAAAGVGMDLAKDGEPKTGRHNFVASLIATGIVGFVLYCGGFFG